jgi:DMSO/TMAO reductase YedYZ molybdopterin-dependent catalytic subunit
MRGSGRVVNAAILTLTVIAVVTGVTAFATGSDRPSTALAAVHGASGLGLLLLAPSKIMIARRGLRRPGRSRKVTAIGLAVAVLAAVASGLLHAVGGFRDYAGLLPMQIHVGAALVATALVAAHVRLHRRRVRLRGTDVTRRTALRGAGLVAGAAALWLLAPGRERRMTGSHETGSGDPRAMPVTNWLLDPVPRIDPATWRLRVTPAGTELDLAALAALPQRSVRAVLDCTGGWWAEQEWRGVPLSTLVAVPPGGSVDIVSATGYRRRIPARDLDGLLLATSAGGRPLSWGHGAPARLVAPGRRGFWWVKWVVAVEAVDAPWWRQAPFPVQ